MAIEGTLDVFQLPDVLQMISQQKKTGILTMQGPDDIIAVSFLDGRIMAADALNETADAGLGEVLVTHGMLTREQLRRLTARQMAGEERLAQLVVSGGHLTRAQLLAALRLRIKKLLVDLFEWREGEFKFYGGDEVSFEEGFEAIEVEEILFQAAELFAAPDPPVVEAPAPAFSPALEAPPAPPVVVSRAAAPAPAGPLAEPVAAPSERAGFNPTPWAAALLVLAMAWVVSQRPTAVLFPHPWQDREQATLENNRRTAALLEVDRAAKTYFLHKGSFPDQLTELVQLGLLRSSDLSDPSGEPLQYAAEAEGYSIASRDPEEPEAREGIVGNFLLDPGIQKYRDDKTTRPLVLLD